MRRIGGGKGRVLPAAGGLTAMRLLMVPLALAMVAGSVLAGCGSIGSTAAAPTPGTESFVDGLEATLVLPADASAEVPLVVLVPGGAWRTAALEGIPELADDLAARGAAVVTVTYRTSDSGEYFPVPVEDVACGLGYAVDAVAGLAVSQVVLGGHSAGANMAALVTLDPEAFANSTCPYDSAAPDAVIGISGPYDIHEAPEPAAYNFFGAPNVRDPSTWDEGNPMAYADRRPEVPALLIHGTADYWVPTTIAEDFAAALSDGGHDVTTHYPEGAGHNSVLDPQVAGPLIADWLGMS